MMTMNLTEGARIHAKWFRAHLSCLAGAQMKFGATQHKHDGVVRHVLDNGFVALDLDGFSGTTPCTLCSGTHTNLDARNVAVISP